MELKRRRKKQIQTIRPNKLNQAFMYLIYIGEVAVRNLTETAAVLKEVFHAFLKPPCTFQ
jgi:hypothetical protein